MRWVDWWRHRNSFISYSQVYCESTLSTYSFYSHFTVWSVGAGQPVQSCTQHTQRTVEGGGDGGGGWSCFIKPFIRPWRLHIKWEITALFNFAWETSGYYRQPTRCQWFCLSGSPYSAEVFNAQTPTVSLPCRNDSRRSRDAAVQIASTFGWLCCQTTWCFTKDSSNCQFRPWHWFTRWLIKSVMDVCDNSFISHWHELLSVYISSIFFCKEEIFTLYLMLVTALWIIYLTCQFCQTHVCSWLLHLTSQSLCCKS